MKKAGILMPVASLPSPHGVGDFGDDSYRFIDICKKAGWNLWQILPLNPLGYGNSPYQPYSSMAGDEIYISLTRLCEEGLIDKVPSYRKNSSRIDYSLVREFKGIYLKKAFHTFQEREQPSEYKEFISQQWVYDYAVFLSLKKQNNMICWNEWPKEQQLWIQDHGYDITHLSTQIEYEMFVQYKFYEQWMKLKSYANSSGIEVMGDIPIYVGIDSLDVWANQECFLLDADSKPSFVAGVPPDYFSTTGQRWGNPIYHWEYLKSSQFAFWLQRLRYSAKLFDIIRIDHFRAFDTYWKIPASCETAIEGEWVEAPGYELFDFIFKEIPEINIVVEDLGELRPEVMQLRDHYGFKGMLVVQFSFGSEEDSSNFDHMENLILYTGTHDNQTIRSWYESQPDNVKQRVIIKLKENGCTTTSAARGLVEFTFKQNCYMSIIPMQDILELSDQARINCPGTLGSPNWEWKMRSLAPFDKVANIPID